MYRVRIVISGRVQGVWFRASMEREARGLGLGGWVRNRPDGSVEAVIEGMRQDVERLVSWAHTGPPGARVERVLQTGEPPEGIRDFLVLG